MFLDIDYFKLIPILSLFIFFVPKNAKGYISLSIVLTGILFIIFSLFEPLHQIEIPSQPNFSVISTIFIIPISIISISSILFSIGDIKSHERTNIELSIHYICLTTLIYSSLFILEATTTYQFLLWWELLTISSFVLLLFNAQNRQTRHLAIGYIVLMQIAFLILLFGMNQLPDDATSLFGYGSMPLWLWAILFISFSVKSGVFPFHLWLTKSHTLAPTHVSILLSGVLSILGLYGIINITLFAQDLLTIGYILFILGLIATIFGVTKSSTRQNFKTLIAYNSVGNIGLVILGLGLGAIGKSSNNIPLAIAGVSGALIHLVNYVCYKTTMLLCAGNIENYINTSRISKMGGLIKIMPTTGFILLLSTLSICFIPPLAGFAGEFIIYKGLFKSISSNQNILISIIAIISIAVAVAMSFITFAKAYGFIMLGSVRYGLETSDNLESKKTPVTTLLSYALPVISIFVGSILLSLIVLENSFALFRIEPITSTTINTVYWVSISSVSVFILGGMLYALKRYLQSTKSITTQPSWSNAFLNVDETTHYNTSDNLIKLANRALNIQSSNHTDLQSPLEIYPVDTKLTQRAKITRTIFSPHLLSLIIKKITSRIKFLQTGVVNHYISYALIFIILIIALTSMGLI